MMRITAFIAILLLSACGSSEWATSYGDVVNHKDASTWRVTEIDVTVPRTLSVSEANRFAPDADIVWREELGGDRYEQVDRIITEAARRGVARLRGKRPVKLVVEVATFHALTEKTRRVLSRSGVHNITFTAQVVDARTGAPLTPVDQIRADLVAYTGEQALVAERAGQTQRVRIIDHVSGVFAGWLGVGPDARGTFSRAGR